MINNMDLVYRGKVANVLRKPYKLDSYRKTDISIWQCIKNIFVIHNDCGNVWTQFIPFLLLTVWLPYISCRPDLSDPFRYLLLTLWLGHVIALLSSSMARYLDINANCIGMCALCLIILESVVI